MWVWSRENITAYVFSTTPVCSSEIVAQYYDLSLDFSMKSYKIIVIVLQIGPTLLTHSVTHSLSYHSLIHFIVFLSILVAFKSLYLVFPHVMVSHHYQSLTHLLTPFLTLLYKALLQQIYQFHVTNLSTYDITIEIIIIMLIAVLLYYKKTIQSYFTKAQKYVEKKSIMLSKALPHIMFFTLCFIISFIGDSLIH